jgi:hypothetical protein
VLSPDQIARLLSNLCTKLGFCLSPVAQAELATAPPPDVDGFAAAVIRAEGLQPELMDRRLYRDARAMVADAFQRAEERR